MEPVPGCLAQGEPGVGALQSGSRTHVPTTQLCSRSKWKGIKLGKASRDLESAQIPLWLLPDGTGRGTGPEAGSGGRV